MKWTTALVISLLCASAAGAFWHGRASAFLGASSTEAVGYDLTTGVGAQ